MKGTSYQGGCKLHSIKWYSILTSCTLKMLELKHGWRLKITAEAIQGSNEICDSVQMLLMSYGLKIKINK